MTLLDTVLARLGRLLAWAAGLCLSLMLLQVIADVIGRLVFAHPLPSTIEIVAEWWMPALIFLPMILVAQRGENIAVDILYDRLPPRLQAASDLIAGLAFALFLVLVSWGAWEQAMRAYAKGEFIMGMIPVITWPARFFLPLAGGLTAIVYVLQALRSVPRLMEPRHG